MNRDFKKASVAALLIVCVIITTHRVVAQAQWSAFPGFATQFSGTLTKPMVRTIYVDGNNLFIGGNFKSISNKTGTKFLAWYDGSTWRAVGDHPPSPHYLNWKYSSNDQTPNNADGVYSICIYKNKLYVGGANNQISRFTPVPSGQWSRGFWETISTYANNAGPLVGGNSGLFNGIIYCMKEYNGDLYLGGTFQGLCGGTWGSVTNITPSNCIVRYDGINFLTLNNYTFMQPFRTITGPCSMSSTNPQKCNTDNFVKALEVYNGLLYIGGRFTHMNINNSWVQTEGIAIWNGTNLLPTSTITGVLTNPLPAMVNDVTGGVYSFTVMPNSKDCTGDLYAGGFFQLLGLPTFDYPPGTKYNNLGKWNAGTFSWDPVITNVNNSGLQYGGSRFVNSICNLNGRLYATGTFENAGNTNSGLNGVANLELCPCIGTSWNKMDPGFARTPPIISYPYIGDYITVYQGKIIACGSFHVNNDPSFPMYLAQWQ